MFNKEVDKRYREAMKAFLQKHFRYHIMNSWNRSTSYANCIKLHQIDKPDDIIIQRFTWLPSRIFLTENNSFRTVDIELFWAKFSTTRPINITE